MFTGGLSVGASKAFFLKYIDFEYWYTIVYGVIYVLLQSIRAVRRLLRGIEKSVKGLMIEKSELFEMFGMGLKYDITDEGELVLRLGFTHVVLFKIPYGVLMKGKDKLVWIISYIVEYARDIRSKMVEVSRMIKYKEKGVIPLLNPILPRVRKEKKR